MMMRTYGSGAALPRRSLVLVEQVTRLIHHLPDFAIVLLDVADALDRQQLQRRSI